MSEKAPSSTGSSESRSSRLDEITEANIALVDDILTEQALKNPELVKKEQDKYVTTVVPISRPFSFNAPLAAQSDVEVQFNPEQHRRTVIFHDYVEHANGREPFGTTTFEITQPTVPIQASSNGEGPSMQWKVVDREEDLDIQLHLSLALQSVRQAA